MERITLSGPHRDRGHLTAELARGGAQLAPVESPTNHGLPEFTDSAAADQATTADMAFLECVGDLSTVSAAAAHFGWVVRVHSDITNEAHHG